MSAAETSASPRSANRCPAASSSARRVCLPAARVARGYAGGEGSDAVTASLCVRQTKLSRAACSACPALGLTGRAPALDHRFSMRAARLIRLLAVCAAVFACASSTAIASGPTKCQEATIFQPDGGLYTQTRKLTAAGVGCVAARKVALRYMSSADSADPDDAPFGYACRRASGRVICTRGSRRVSWGYYTGSDRECGMISGLVFDI